MHIGIIDHPARHSAFLAEFFSTWGAAFTQTLHPGELASRSPAVVVVPADCEAHEESLVRYATAGGTVIAILPTGALLHAAGLVNKGTRETPTAMRWSGFLPGGFEGETCPIVGEAHEYDKNTHVERLAHFVHPNRFLEKSVAITRTAVGKGSVVCIAFDLPRCVMMMRQGDPAFAEHIPEGDACARPSHMAARFEAGESAWMPFADLLARALVQIATDALAIPCPLISHLPADASALLLYSGDEDGSPVHGNDEEFNYLTQNGARMDLYIIPDITSSTREDAKRYLQHHDLGVHPNLRPFDGRPIAERLELLESQIKLFETKFGMPSLTMRNHCTAWAGYMEPVEVMERCGVRMDGSFFAGRYGRGFDSSPYGAFGAAMPMKFCRPDGRLLGVYQQHTAISDDVFFAPDQPTTGAAHYSFNLSPETSSVVMRRILRDCLDRFHTPLGVNLHPGNWIVFSRAQGQMLVQTAGQLGIPVWSFTQWCRFWMARATWKIESLSWKAPCLSFKVQGTPMPSPLCVAIPAEHAGQSLRHATLDGRPLAVKNVTRFRRRVALATLPAQGASFQIDAVYEA